MPGGFSLMKTKIDRIIQLLETLAAGDGAQIPGSLPRGFTLDSLLTVEQFAVWRQKAVETVRDELPTTAGVIKRTKKDQRIHPRTYLEQSMKPAH